MKSKVWLTVVWNCEQRWRNLVTIAQVAVAFPAAGTGTTDARGGLRGRGLGAQRRVLVLATDELCLRRRTFPQLPQTCCKAGCHGNAATTVDVDWNRFRVENSRWEDGKTKRRHWWSVMEWWCEALKLFRDRVYALSPSKCIYARSHTVAQAYAEATQYYVWNYQRL